MGRYLMLKETIILSGIPRNRILLLFSILDFQFVLPQYLLIGILLNESSSLLCSRNPKIVYILMLRVKRGKTVSGW